MTRRTAAGFSLVEILVVLVLFGLGLFLVLPGLAPRRGGPHLDTLEQFLAEARRDAVHQGALQRICFRYGSRDMIRGNATLRLESPLAAAALEGQRVPGAGGCFSIYPSGLMDDVSLRLASGEVYRSRMLTGRLERKDPSRTVADPHSQGPGWPGLRP